MKSSKFVIGTESKNSYTDFKLIETSVVISSPQVKTNYLEVPGRMGSIDLTDALTGYPIYKDRTITWTYNMLPRQNWLTIRRSVYAFLHGKYGKVYLDEDNNNYYYQGRFSVDSVSKSGMYYTITISATVEPFKIGSLTGQTRTVTDYYDFTINSDAPTTVTLDTVVGFEYSVDGGTTYVTTTTRFTSIYIGVVGGATIRVRTTGDSGDATTIYQARAF